VITRIAFTAVAGRLTRSVLPIALATAVLPALPAQAMTSAQHPLPGFHLMWATKTAMRLGWRASPAAQSYSYRLDQMNGIQARSGQEPGDLDTVTVLGLHPGWRYRCTVWAEGTAPETNGTGQEDNGSAQEDNGSGREATLYVTLPEPAPPREYAYQWAESQAGSRYSYGAEGHGAYDCSGLVRTAYLHAGIWLPRTTGEMLDYQRLQRESTPRQGDLVFFGTGHVELYDSRDKSFGAETNPDTGVWWYRWWPDNWWPTAFYRVHGAG
jgi:cell wall-associated NlpC family hydrolase